MFPNVRFMIAAVAASVVVLVSGFALFAIVRVGHEPLSRLASGATPMQLVADSTPLETRQSFGVRYQMLQEQITGTAAVQPPAPVVEDKPAGTAPVSDDNVAPAKAAAPIASIEPEQATPEQAAPAAPAPEPKQDASATPSGGAPATDTAAVAGAPPAPSAASDTATAATSPEQAIPAAAVTAAVEQPAAAEPAIASVSDTATPPSALEPPPPAPQTAAAEPTAPAERPASAEPDGSQRAASPDATPRPHHKVRHTRMAARPRPGTASTPGYTQASAIGGPFVPAPGYTSTTTFASSQTAGIARPARRTRKAIAAAPNTP